MNRLRALLDFCATFRNKPWPLEKPVVLQFPVNDICDARCRMCHVWQQKLGKQISCDELQRVLKNPLFSEIRYVGINGGEPTLRNDLAELVGVLTRRLPKMEGVSLITNALAPARVIGAIEDIAKVLCNAKISFDVMLSLDGVGDVHDQVRGCSGAFENVSKVIQYLRDSKVVANYALGCTVINKNVYGLHDLLDFAIAQDVYIKFRLGIPHRRLYNEAVAGDFSLSFAEKVHFATFLESLVLEYESSLQQQYFYRSLIGQLIYNQSRKAGCDWQHRGVTLSSQGELLYCAVASKVLGSALDGDANQVYFDGQAYLRELVENKCAECAHDYGGLIPGTEKLKSRIRYAMEKRQFPLNIVDRVPLGPGLTAWRSQRLFVRRLKSFTLAGDKHPPAQTFKDRQKNSAKQVMICGWYGTETLGDKAILGGVLKATRESLGPIDLTIVSLQPAVSKLTATQMPELQNAFICTVAEGIKLSTAMDLVVFGGGPLMALDNLAEMIAIFERAAQHGVPTLMAGCGVGPLGASWHNKAVKRLLKRFSQRIYRDEKSRQLAVELGVKADTDIVAEDPAFTWLEQKSSSFRPRKHKQVEDLTLIMGLRKWPYSQYAYHLSAAEGELIKDRFEAALIEGLAQLLERFPGVKILPFPMCTNHLGGDDRWYYRELFRKYKNLADALDYSALSRELSPDEALNFFAEADAALTMRFHSLVFALGLGLPCVAIDYTLGRGKVASLAGAHGVPCRSLLEVDPEFILEELSTRLKSDHGHARRAVNIPAASFSSAVAASLKRLN